MKSVIGYFMVFPGGVCFYLISLLPSLSDQFILRNAIYLDSLSPPMPATQSSCFAPSLFNRFPCPILLILLILLIFVIFLVFHCPSFRMVFSSILFDCLRLSCAYLHYVDNSAHVRGNLSQQHSLSFEQQTPRIAAMNARMATWWIDGTTEWMIAPLNWVHVYRHYLYHYICM